ncbi:MAG TPA: signal peptidase II [Phycisphaerae bacterium]|nr:signal peptidase II [Phycisphaerae bacterium]
MPHTEKETRPADAAPGREHRAISSGPAVALFLLIVAFGAAADLLSKHLVFERLLDDPAIEREVRENYLSDPLPERDRTQEFSRAVLQKLHIQERICFGLSFTLSVNPGVVFGFDRIPIWIVNIITICMILFVLIFFAASPRRARWMHVALALILGGAIGNLYDRVACKVVLPGLTPIQNHVRDFIDCSDLGYRYIFNVADIWLVAGVIMILLHWVWLERKTKKGEKSASKT